MVLLRGYNQIRSKYICDFNVEISGKQIVNVTVNYLIQEHLTYG